MKRQLDKNRLYLAIGALIILAVAVTAGALAWYSNNRRVDSVYDRLSTEQATSVICEDYLVFLRHTDENGEKTYEVRNTLDAVEMNTYDSVFGRNEDTAIVLQIPLSGEIIEKVAALSVVLDRENPEDRTDLTDSFGLLATQSNSSFNLENGKIANYLTNISDYRFTVIPSLNGVIEDSSKELEKRAEEIYEGAVSAVKDQTATTFAGAAYNSTTKQYTVTKTTNSITTQLTGYGDAVKNGDEMYIYVVIDYQQELIAAYLRNHEGNFEARKLDETQMLKFEGDLHRLTVTAAGD